MNWQKNLGFTLIELMVALAAGAILLSGVAMSYSAIKSTLQTAQDIELAQEVIRYTNQVLTRSIKQATTDPQVLNNGKELLLQQAANTVSCTGVQMVLAYTEHYVQDGIYLTCDTGSGAVKLVKGLSSIDFAYNSLLTSITVTPTNAVAPFENGVRIDISASQLVLVNAYGS
ncbi:Prepilin-type cleavage/methylation-like protein [Pseudoalteromonas luteoviolacea B = ATCC 29581]|nr:Prepilin-type cleavage/methylation-like protein [Pseudoalteromonas luteoviolacea B = ATCC 29581]